jgi:hypothetical protein
MVEMRVKREREYMYGEVQQDEVGDKIWNEGGTG